MVSEVGGRLCSARPGYVQDWPAQLETWLVLCRVPTAHRPHYRDAYRAITSRGVRAGRILRPGRTNTVVTTRTMTAGIGGTAERWLVGALNRAADEEAHRNGLTGHVSTWFSAGPAGDPYGSEPTGDAGEDLVVRRSDGSAHVFLQVKAFHCRDTPPPLVPAGRGPAGRRPPGAPAHAPPPGAAARAARHPQPA